MKGIKRSNHTCQILSNALALFREYDNFDDLLKTDNCNFSLYEKHYINSKVSII